MPNNESSIPLGNHWLVVGETSKNSSEFSQFLNSIRPKAQKFQTVDDCQFDVYDASVHLEIQLLTDHKNNFYSAYPALKLNGYKSEKVILELKAINEWEGSHEAELVSTFHGAQINFFDTAYYINRRQYEIGRKYEFWLGAIAYKIQR